MLAFHHEKSLSPETVVAVPLRMSTVDFPQARGWLWGQGNTNGKKARAAKPVCSIRTRKKTRKK